MADGECDVLVIGCGAAGTSAGLAARVAGAKVINLETAPKEWRGGNTAFAGGGLKVARDGIGTFAELHPDVTSEELAKYNIVPYSEDDYYNDIMRVTRGYADPELAQTLVQESLPTARWLKSFGYKFRRPDRAAKLNAEGKLTVSRAYGIASPVGEGHGLVDQMTAIGEKEGVSYLYEHKAMKLLQDERGRVCGATVLTPEGYTDFRSKAVIIATGGFESNREMRTRYLGPSWSFLRPRGTRYNQGLGLKMALEIGAQPSGHWSGAHCAPMDWHVITETPEGTTLPVPSHKHWWNAGLFNSRLAYFVGISVNHRGDRFIDEGAEYMPYTYVPVGIGVSEQSNATAWQIFDARAMEAIRSGRSYGKDEYTVGRPEEAPTIDALAREIGAPNLGRTVEEFNASIDGTATEMPDYTVLDGYGTCGLEIPKTNWARPISTAPFTAYKVTTGITFTFGGLKINSNAQVLDTEGRVIRGLYAAGNTVGFWYYNYPGGGAASLATTFGRLGGTHAAAV